MSVDPYSDPASGVLRNRFGITDPDRLRVVEADLTAAALADLGTRILPAEEAVQGDILTGVRGV